MQSSHSRRAARALALAAAGVSCALFAQTVGLQPGMYEFVSTSDVKLTPQMQSHLPAGYAEKLAQPRTQQHCITDTDLAKLSRQLTEERGRDPSCKLTDQSVSGHEVKFVMQCGQRTSSFAGTFATDSFRAEINSTTKEGEKLKVNMTGKRVGACK